MLSLRKCSVYLPSVLGLGLVLNCSLGAFVLADDKLPPVEVKDSQATSQADMKPYAEIIEQTEATIDMLPIPGGKFMMGSPESEPNRKADEGPQHEVEISPT